MAIKLEQLTALLEAPKNNSSNKHQINVYHYIYIISVSYERIYEILQCKNNSGALVRQ
jgi:hypothetical protein